MTNKRTSPINITKAGFQQAGHRLIDEIAAFLDGIDERPVTTGEPPKKLQEVLGLSSLPEKGQAPGRLLARTTQLLFNHSLFNSHPRFFGYITSSPSPIGALADLLAAAVNPNVGANILSPMATEIERQTVKWLAEFIGVSPSCGGLLVSGGNMANFTGFLAGRTAKAPKNFKEEGMSGSAAQLIVYCCKSTHTWIEKAMVLFGLGTRSLRWIPTDSGNRMDLKILKRVIQDDLKQGCKPIMVVGTAGDVSTGAVDDLAGIAMVCKKYKLWFHVDGAYGIPAAVIPELKELFRGIDQADSIALDPHKWLYSPLEAGCTLVKDPNHLLETFSSHPVYYNFSGDEPLTQNYYEYGLQNSRGFRALKVWLGLQQAGRAGYIKMISDDIGLSKYLFEKAGKHPELEAVTQHLSIATFRYVPVGFDGDQAYLNTLNEALLNELQRAGEVFFSNAVVNDMYCLRACIVNFRTTKKDILEVINVTAREGRKLHERLQAQAPV